MEKLGGVLSEIVSLAEEKNKLRCPYKRADMLCSFAGGCPNQQRQQNRVHCGGDEAIFGITIGMERRRSGR